MWFVLGTGSPAQAGPWNFSRGCNPVNHDSRAHPPAGLGLRPGWRARKATSARTHAAEAGDLRRALALLAVPALVLAGCGSSAEHVATSRTVAGSGGALAASTATAASKTGASAAENPSSTEFPHGEGKTLGQLARLATAHAQFAAGTVTFTPRDRRVAFGIIDSTGRFVYAPTAIYIANRSTSPARGPFRAPADPMTVARQYRSNENDGPGGLQAMYSANVSLPHPGRYTVLALSRTAHGLVGAIGQIVVAPSSPIPDVGQRAPAIATDTPASVRGKLGLLTTRVPPEHMHAVSFNAVLGKRPIVLLFSTPALCQSRVCGPVTDIAVELQHEYGSRIAFLHEEVYVDNQPSRGLRPQLRAFHLRTEPWLFAVNRNGVIVARLEGAFGTAALRRALDAALR